MFNHGGHGLPPGFDVACHQSGLGGFVQGFQFRRAVVQGAVALSRGVQGRERIVLGLRLRFWLDYFRCGMCRSSICVRSLFFGCRLRREVCRCGLGSIHLRWSGCAFRHDGRGRVNAFALRRGCRVRIDRRLFLFLGGQGCGLVLGGGAAGAGHRFI